MLALGSLGTFELADVKLVGAGVVAYTWKLVNTSLPEQLLNIRLHSREETAFSTPQREIKGALGYLWRSRAFHVRREKQGLKLHKVGAPFPGRAWNTTAGLAYVFCS